MKKSFKIGINAKFAIFAYIQYKKITYLNKLFFNFLAGEWYK